MPIAKSVVAGFPFVYTFVAHTGYTLSPEELPSSLEVRDHIHNPQHGELL
jgi:hypothetical protein